MTDCGNDPFHGWSVCESIAIVINAPLEVNAIEAHLPWIDFISKNTTSRNLQTSMAIHPHSGRSIPQVKRSQHHIDDTSDRLAAKTCTRWPLDDLDLLHHAHGKAVERIRRSQAAKQGNTIHQHQGIHPLHAVHLNAVGATHSTPHRFAHTCGEIERFHQVLGMRGTQ